MGIWFFFCWCVDATHRSIPRACPTFAFASCSSSSLVDLSCSSLASFALFSASSIAVWADVRTACSALPRAFGIQQRCRYARHHTKLLTVAVLSCSFHTAGSSVTGARPRLFLAAKVSPAGEQAKRAKAGGITPGTPAMALPSLSLCLKFQLLTGFLDQLLLELRLGRDLLLLQRSDQLIGIDIGGTR